ncbi:MAG TPA: LemA family protein, partial [Vicinamibacterales bacterium]
MTPVLLVALSAVGVVGIVLYNGLVGARQRVREAWSAIDVQLQRRASLIPNLVESVKGYANYERETLRRLTEARSALGSAASPAAAALANA